MVVREEVRLGRLTCVEGRRLALVQMPEVLALVLLERGRCPLVELFHLRVRHVCSG
jgi:hypothetical protein